MHTRSRWLKTNSDPPKNVAARQHWFAAVYTSGSSLPGSRPVFRASFLWTPTCRGQGLHFQCLDVTDRFQNQFAARERASLTKLEQLRARDAEAGLRIQQFLLLDPPPDLPGLQIAALTIPSQRIDGDFYIFIAHQDDTLDFIVGDVMGKGIPAALLAAATKSEFLKALAYMAVSERGILPNPRDVVMLTHAGLVRQLIKLDSFVSLCYARLDADHQTVSLVDCGHTGMLQWHASTRRSEILHGEGLPLGIREGEIFESLTAAVSKNDIMLFFSDGITEARNRTGETFGFERLMRHMDANASLECAALLESIHQAVANFSGSACLKDDLTVLAIRIGERPALARDALAIRSHLRELRAVRSFVRQFCTEHVRTAPNDGFIDDLELAVTEAASNIMRHAYLGHADQWIRVEAEASSEAVSMRLRHLGRPFAPDDEPKLPRGNRETGLGRYIIAHSVDRVFYQHDEFGRNGVSLVKFLKSRKERDSDGIADR